MIVRVLPDRIVITLSRADAAVIGYALTAARPSGSVVVPLSDGRAIEIRIPFDADREGSSGRQ